MVISVQFNAVLLVSSGCDLQFTPEQLRVRVHQCHGTCDGKWWVSPFQSSDMMPQMKALKVSQGEGELWWEINGGIGVPSVVKSVWYQTVMVKR